MKVIKSYLGYASLYNLGKLAYFIEVDQKKGYYVDEKELVENIYSYNTIFIVGDVFKDRDSTKKMCSLLVKNNNNIIIHLIGKCVNVPIGLGLYTHNIKYHVLISDDMKLERRILNWFIRAYADFLFDISNEDDIDRALLIANEYEIPNQYITMYKDGIIYGKELDELINCCLKYSVNFLVDFGKMFWPIEKKEEDEYGETYYDILEVVKNEKE